MKKNLFFLFFFSMFLQLGWSQASISIWKVEGKHQHNHEHSHDAKYQIYCGEETYINYQGAETTETITLSIRNDGDATVNLNTPIELNAGSGPAFTISEQPDKNTLNPGEEALFKVLYTAPDDYDDIGAALTISSDAGDCLINFDVGDAPNPIPSAQAGCATCLFRADNVPLLFDGFGVDSTIVNVPVDPTLVAVEDFCLNLRMVADIGGVGFEQTSFLDEGDNFIGLTPNSAGDCQPSGGSANYTLSAADYNLYAADGFLTFTIARDPDIDNFCASSNVSICIGTNDIDFGSQNELTFGDPCSCGDPRNCQNAGVYYFHDTLTIPEMGTISSGLDIRINASSGFFIDVPCFGAGLTEPSYGQFGTQIMETAAGSGVYKIEFWRPSGVQPTLQVINGGLTTDAPAATFQPICSFEDCPVVVDETLPTMNKWSILFFGLLIVGLGAFFMYRMRL
ncbi:MAG: hypothetical protein AAF242_02210 [Bacteroidota bacterium]